MNDLNVKYKNHKDKYLYCLKNDKSYGLRKGKGYKILEVVEDKGEYFYKIMTEKANIPLYSNGISFKCNSEYFLSVKESQAKLREHKLKQILGGTTEQTYYE